ncbi:HET-domain-containing protein [Xylariaceae sp. AK1471]|nr:HET-domain-containing protein [Xylariaceae sp. AK1471]
MALCARCERRNDAHGRSVTIVSLRETPCEFCRVVYEGIIAVLSPIKPSDSTTATLPAFSSENRGRFEVHIFVHHTVLSFWCSWGTQCPWGFLPTARDITPLESSGIGSFERALEWIQKCVDTHDCGGVVNTILPTRVLDIGLRCESPIRVVCGSSRTERYVCLSHCWGSKPQLITTEKTLPDYEKEIAWSVFPATFKDAITISRRLGIRYIWIDSLCIVQDSPRDWARESARMADIYRNSYLTIAAASSRDGAGGLYLKDQRQKGVTLTGTTSLGKTYNIRVQYGILAHTHLDDETPKGVIQHPISVSSSMSDVGGTREVFPLLTRGWVFQERLLSPRFLQFGKHELLWDCRRSILCECGQRPPDLPYNQVSPRVESTLLAHSWRKIVEFYSALELTYPTDKLPALSGLAKRMGERRPDATYLAGLWKDSLDLDLLWVPYGSERRQSDDYIAPSWSWTKSSRKIAYPSVWRSQEAQPSVKVIGTYFEAVEARCTPGSDDPTGRVLEGYLVLDTPLCQLMLQPSSTDGGARVIHCGDTGFSVAGHGESNDLRSSWRLPFENNESRKVFLDRSDALDGPLGDTYGCRLTRVEILENSTFVFAMDARETIQVEFGLLLERIDDEKPHTYRRIGLLMDGRIIDGHRGDAASWLKEGSCFDKVLGRTRITII